jgi:hypothetical protein
MEVHNSHHQYLCSLEGDLVDQLEDISVFEATLDMAKISPGKREWEIVPDPGGSSGPFWASLGYQRLRLH